MRLKGAICRKVVEAFEILNALLGLDYGDGDNPIHKHDVWEHAKVTMTAKLDRSSADEVDEISSSCL